MTTILYLRHSPRPKRPKKRAAGPDHESIETQRGQCEAYCRYAGLPEPYLVFEEPLTSGAQWMRDRPVGAQVVAKLATPGHHYLVSQRLDRLHRDPADAILMSRIWHKAGVTVHLAAQGGCTINTRTATGRFMYYQLAVNAGFERDMTIERTKASMANRQQRGQRMSSRAPYGFRIDPDDPTRIVEDPREQAIIRRILELAERKYGLRHIGRKLESEGLGCRGNGWHHGTIKAIISKYENANQPSHV